MKKMLFALCAAAVFEAAAAQNVREQFAFLAAEPARAGFQISHDEVISTLEEGQSATYFLTLYEDTNYLVFGASDDRSRRLTLSVYDENFHKIDLSDGQDAYPKLSVRPKWTGLFRVKVTMDECRAATCAFGLLFLEHE